MHAVHQSRPSPSRVPIYPLKPLSMTLKDSIDYALEAKGSGFRRRLAQGVGEVCGLDARVVDMLSEGIEYFHHASLIFDDLPCMDDASERRGRRCLHRVSGESKAILAALALVNRAYTMCWRASADFPDRSPMAGRVVERCIGEMGILDGQARDLSFETALGAKEVKAIAGRKTGALLQLTLLLPSVLIGLVFSELLGLSRVARYWGIAYQGMDDFNDLLMGNGTSGKTPFRDLAKARPNLVVVLGKSEAHAEISKCLHAAMEQIGRLVAVDPKWGFLFEFHAVLDRKEAALRAALEAA